MFPSSVEELVNFCLICCSGEENSDFVKIFANDNGALSSAGKMYEELLGLQIDLSKMDIYPQYLCNSCDLQLKIFQQIKAKASFTLDKLHRFFSSESETNGSHITDDKEISFKEEEIHIELQPYEEEFIEDYDNESETISVDFKTQSSSTNQLLQDSMQNNLPNSEDEHFFKEEFLESDEQDHSHQQTSQENLEEDQVEDTSSNISDWSFSQEKEVDYLDYADYLEGSNKRNRNPVKYITPKPKTMTKYARSYSDFTCGTCGKRMKTQESLTAHVNSVHLGLPAYQCELCPKHFKQKAHLAYHMAMHNNIRNFKCGVCDKAFITKSDLNIHQRFHDGERPYKCDTCGKTYTLFQHLKMHQFSHNRNVNFFCEICGQNFVSPTTLKAHMQTVHVAIPKYRCDKCGKYFKRKNNLMAHVKIHERIERQSQELECKITEEIVDDVEPNQDLYSNEDQIFVITGDSDFNIDSNGQNLLQQEEDEHSFYDQVQFDPHQFTCLTE